MYLLGAHQLSDEGLKRIYGAPVLSSEIRHFFGGDGLAIPRYFWTNVCDQGDFTYWLVERRYTQELTGARAVCAVAIEGFRWRTLYYGIGNGVMKDTTDYLIEGNLLLLSGEVGLPLQRRSIPEFAGLDLVIPPPVPRRRLRLFSRSG